MIKDFRFALSFSILQIYLTADTSGFRSIICLNYVI